MVDSFNRRLERESVLGRLVGLQIAHNVRSINHSQFVDDTLLLSKASKIIDRRFKGLFDTYLEASRAKVNNLKVNFLAGIALFIFCGQSQQFWNSPLSHLGNISNTWAF